MIARGNVAADIHAVRDIEYVILGGELLDRPRLLSDAAQLAAADLPAKTVPPSPQND
ncbi:MAG: hypothetical protein LC804_09840 [Acidobacteria bacterium]|nr:hypothetical protein [Acidobacteriota bacterium]